MVMADAPIIHHAINITRTKVNCALMHDLLVEEGGFWYTSHIPMACASEETVSAHSKLHVHIFISVWHMSWDLWRQTLWFSTSTSCAHARFTCVIRSKWENHIFGNFETNTRSQDQRPWASSFQLWNSPWRCRINGSHTFIQKLLFKAAGKLTKPTKNFSNNKLSATVFFNTTSLILILPLCNRV